MFDKLITLVFKVFVYRKYRQKYTLNPSFRFNGYFIRIKGKGDFVAGKNSYISFFSYVNIIEGTKLTIGSDVSIAHNVKIYTSGIDTKKLIIEKEKVTVKGDVLIGDNVLIGSNSFICPGVVIGNNVVIGANSVVTCSVPENTVSGGVPAKVIKVYD